MALPYATEDQLKILERKTKADLDRKTANINLTANTLDDMNKLITDGSVDDGQLCYCKADKKLYVLKDNVWSEVGGGGSSIPVVEGTESTTTTDGAYATYTIPEAQTSCFIFKCDLGVAFVSYNDAFGTYNGYLDAEGSVTDGSLKLNDIIVLSGSGTTIDIFFGNIGGPGGGEGITPKPITSTADYASLTDTDYLISVNITGNSNVKNGTYILSGNKANGYSYWYPEDKSEGLNMQTYWHYIHYDSTGLTAIIFNSFLDVTDNNKVGFGFNSKFPNNNIFGGFSVRQVPLFSKYTLVTNTTDEITPILPCTASDNGKVLSVVNGEAQWASASGGVSVTFED